MALPIAYSSIDSGKGFYATLVVLGGFIAAAAASFLYVEHHGHVVTGMTKPNCLGFATCVCDFFNCCRFWRA